LKRYIFWGRGTLTPPDTCVLKKIGRANGFTKSTKTAYDGYAECVKTTFDSKVVSIEDLIHYF
jgi:peptide methionine sulfoxide reductase MsrA